MAWFADKARNILSRGRTAGVDDSATPFASGGAKVAYHETGLSLPLESGHTSYLDGALEQVQADAGIRAVLEKAGIPDISAADAAPEPAESAARKRGAELPEEEHRLLTAFVLLGNGDAKFRGGYFTSAESAYREAQKAAATREKSIQGICLSSLAAAIAMQGKHDQALKLVEEALRRKPDLAEAWYNKGVALLHFSRHAEAVPCFDEALVHKAELAEAWYNKGIALGNLGRHGEALPCFTEALGRGLQDADTWLGKGAAQLMLGLQREAIASFEEALRRRQGFAAAWLGKGLGLMMLRRHGEALPCFDKAIDSRPEFAEAWLGKGQTLGDMGRHEAAAACFDKALLYKAELAHAWLAKGVSLERLGWWKQALAAHERARSLEKGKP